MSRDHGNKIKCFRFIGSLQPVSSQVQCGSTVWYSVAADVVCGSSTVWQQMVVEQRIGGTAAVHLPSRVLIQVLAVRTSVLLLAGDEKRSHDSFKSNTGITRATLRCHSAPALTYVHELIEHFCSRCALRRT